MNSRLLALLVGALVACGLLDALAQFPSRPPLPRPPRITTIPEMPRTDPALAKKSPQQRYLAEVLLNVQAAQRASNYFRDQGNNWASGFLGVSLAISAFVTGLSVAVQGAKLNSKSASLKNKAALALACVATLSSSIGLYLHHESERFLKENRDEYIGLSLDLNEAIADFYIAFRDGGFSDQTVSDPKVMQSLVELDKATGQRISTIAKSYNQKYGINTTAPPEL